MKPKNAVVTGLLALALGNAQAELFNRGDGLIYDDDLNITWLANANYGAGSVYDTSDGSTDGRMTWANAVAWTANLSFTYGARIYSNWRLPTTLQPDASCSSVQGGDYLGHGCAGSEMGHLFYSELGGRGQSPLVTSLDPDLAKFTNIQNMVYWSGSDYALDPGDMAWLFDMDGGYQGWHSKNGAYFAWAVRDGDVAPIPEPETYAMMLAGLGLFGLTARRRRQKLNA